MALNLAQLLHKSYTKRHTNLESEHIPAGRAYNPGKALVIMLVVPKFNQIEDSSVPRKIDPLSTLLKGFPYREQFSR